MRAKADIPKRLGNAASQASQIISYIIDALRCARYAARPSPLTLLA